MSPVSASIVKVDLITLASYSYLCGNINELTACSESVTQCPDSIVQPNSYGEGSMGCVCMHSGCSDFSLIQCPSSG